jgi:hypothetical protein
MHGGGSTGSLTPAEAGIGRVDVETLGLGPAVRRRAHDDELFG